MPDTGDVVAIAGSDNENYGLARGVWTSAGGVGDAVSWEQVAASVPWESGGVVAAAPYAAGGWQIVMVIIDGVWSSRDTGVTWEEVVDADAVPWDTNEAPLVVASDGRIIRIGGATPYPHTMRTDVFRTSVAGDAAHWEKITDPEDGSEWFVGAMDRAAAITPQDDIVLSGGGGTPDVWLSNDLGDSWHLATSSPGWPAVAKPLLAATADGAVVMAGAQYFGEVWISRDVGTYETWARVHPVGGWSTRFSAGVVTTRRGDILVVGGGKGLGGGEYEYYSDVWRLSCSPPFAAFACATCSEGACDGSGAGAGHDLARLDATSFVGAPLEGDSLAGECVAPITWEETRANTGSGAPGAFPARMGFASVTFGDGTLAVLGGNNDGALNDVWLSNDEGRTWFEASYSGTRWGARWEHAACVTPSGHLFVSAGYFGGHDVWRSTDRGASWTKMTASEGWAGTPNREAHRMASLSDGTLVVIAGVIHGGVMLNDVWTSADAGTTWEVATANAPWEARYRPGVAVLDAPADTMILVGGFDDTGGRGLLLDCWVSADRGVTWTERTPSGGLPWTNQAPRVVVLPRPEWPVGAGGSRPDSSVLVVGAEPGAWVTHDQGAHWSRVPISGGSPAWQRRRFVGVFATLAGRLVAIGGYSPETNEMLNDVWTARCPARDGVTGPACLLCGSAPGQHACPRRCVGDEASGRAGFTQWSAASVVDDPIVQVGGAAGMPWTGRFGFGAATLLDDSLLVFGGRDQTEGGQHYVNDVWRSDTAGASWTRVTTSAAWSPRYYFASTVMPDSGHVYIAGGAIQDPSWRTFDELWRSDVTGHEWAQVPKNGDAGAWFAPRAEMSMVALRSGGPPVLLLMAGDYSNAIFRSADRGVSWETVSVSGGVFSPRTGQRAAVVAVGGGHETVVLAGGFSDDGTAHNDCWASSNAGTTWAQLTASAPWVPRLRHALVVAPGGVLVLAGGQIDASPTDNNDVWLSADGGAAWTRAGGVDEWPGRSEVRAVLVRDRSGGRDAVAIGLLSGYETQGATNDVWHLSSTLCGVCDEACLRCVGPTSSECAGALGDRACAEGFIEDVTGACVSCSALVSVDGPRWGGQGAHAGLPFEPASPLCAALRPGRSLHAALTLPNTEPPTVLVLGGYVGFVGGNHMYSNDVLASTDSGNSWRLIGDEPECRWSARAYHAAAVVPGSSGGGADADAAVVCGGRIYDNVAEAYVVLRDCWVSRTAGATWTQTLLEGDAGQWTARSSMSIAVVPTVDGGHRLVMTGGEQLGNVVSDEVWVCDDGEGREWYLVEVASSPRWAARASHASVGLPDGRVVMVGGYLGAGSYSDEVWVGSNDAVHWTAVGIARSSAVGLSWAARQGHAMVLTSNDTVLVMGGWSPGVGFRRDVVALTASEIDASVAGGGSVDAELRRAAPLDGAPWSPRSGLAATVTPNGDVIVVGGDDAQDGVELADTWVARAPSASCAQGNSYATCGEARSPAVARQVHALDGVSCPACNDACARCTGPTASRCAGNVGLRDCAPGFAEDGSGDGVCHACATAETCGTSASVLGSCPGGPGGEATQCADCAALSVPGRGGLYAHGGGDDRDVWGARLAPKCVRDYVLGTAGDDEAAVCSTVYVSAHGPVLAAVDPAAVRDFEGAISAGGECVASVTGWELADAQSNRPAEAPWLRGIAADARASSMWVYFLDSAARTVQRAPLVPSYVDASRPDFGAAHPAASEVVLVSSLAGYVAQPAHLALDLALGVGYASDASTGTIVRFALPAVNESNFAPTPPVVVVRVVGASPAGLAVDPRPAHEHTLFVADTVAGNVGTLAPTQVGAGCASGSCPVPTVLVASLASPEALAIDIGFDSDGTSVTLFVGEDGGVRLVRLQWTDDAGGDGALGAFVVEGTVALNRLPWSFAGAAPAHIAPPALAGAVMDGPEVPMFSVAGSALPSAQEAAAALRMAPSFVEIGAGTQGLDGSLLSASTLQAEDNFGQRAAGLRDLNDDGVADLIVGSPGDDDGASRAGAAYILFLGRDDTVVSHTKISGTTGGLSEAIGGAFVANTNFGQDVCGFVDPAWHAAGGPTAAVTVPFATANKGAVYWLWLAADGTVATAVQFGDGTLGGLPAGTLAAGDQFGSGLCEVPRDDDIDGDVATHEVLVGAPNTDDGGGTNRGVLYVLFVAAGSMAYRDHMVIRPSGVTGGVTLPYPNDDMHFASSLAWMGDLDFDGAGDLTVGVPGSSRGGPDRGAAYVMLLDGAAADGSVRAFSALWPATLSKLIEAQHGGAAGIGDGDWWGISLAALPDMDNSGTSELAVGAPQHDAGYVDIVFLGPGDTSSGDPPVVPVALIRMDPSLHTMPTRVAGRMTDAAATQFGRGIALVARQRRYRAGVPVASLLLASASPNDDAGGLTDAGSVFLLRLEAPSPSWDSQRRAEWVPDSVRMAPTAVELSAATQGQYAGMLDAGTVDATVNTYGFGWAVSSLGDLDGDCVPDMIVGIRWAADGGFSDSGAALVLLLRSDGTVKHQQRISASESPAMANAFAAGDLFGASVLGLQQDWNGDGVVDAFVGASGANTAGANNVGALYHLRLRRDGSVISYKRKSRHSVGDIVLEDGDGFGLGLTVVPEADDLDSDVTTGEIFAGAVGDNNGGPSGNSERGAVYLLVMRKSDANVLASKKFSEGGDAGWAPVNPSDLQNFGYALAWLGDIDGSGYGAVAMSAREDVEGGTHTGAVYIVHLDAAKRDGTVAYSTKLSTTQGRLIEAQEEAGLRVTGTFDAWGSSVAALGSLDGDDRTEVAVGAVRGHNLGAVTGYIDVLFLEADGSVRAVIRLDKDASRVPAAVAATIHTSAHWGGAVALIARELVQPAGAAGELRQVITLAVGAGYDTVGSDPPGSTSPGAAYVYKLDVPQPAPTIERLTAAGAAPGFTRATGTTLLEQARIDVHTVSASIVDVSSRTEGKAGFLAADTLRGHETGSAGLSGLGDVDGDGSSDIIAGMHHYGESGTGAVLVIFMHANNTVKAQRVLADDTDDVLELDVGDQFGNNAIGLGDDYDGNGVPDAAVGALAADRCADGSLTCDNYGRLHLLYLNADGSVKADHIIGDGVGGLPAGTLAAQSLFSAGLAAVPPRDDLDGDDATATVIATELGYQSSRGAVLVMQINKVDAQVVASTKIHDGAAGFAFRGAADASGALLFGAAVAWVGGDTVAISARNSNDGGPQRGAVYICALEYEHSDMSVAVAVLDKLSSTRGGVSAALARAAAWYPSRSVGIVDYDHWGNGLAAAGDIDADGVADIVVGVRRGQELQGYVDLVMLDSRGSCKGAVRLSPTSGYLPPVFSHRIEPGSVFGASVTVLRRRDALRYNSGQPPVMTLAVSAPLDGPEYPGTGVRPGAVFVLDVELCGSGKVVPATNAELPLGEPGSVAQAAHDRWLRAPAFVSHLRVTHHGDSTQGTDGSLESGTIVTGDQFGSWGNGPAVVGDLDGNGVADVLVGSMWADDGASDAGAATVLLLNEDDTIAAQQRISKTSGLPGLPAGAAFGVASAGVRPLWASSSPDAPHAVVGSYMADDNRGALWFLWLDTDGSLVSHHELGDGTVGGFSAGTLDEHPWLGAGLCVVPEADDLDGDSSTGTVIAGAAFYGTPDRGAAYVITVASATGEYVDHTVIAEGSGAGWAPVNPTDSQGFGIAIAWLQRGGAGGAGTGDLVVGAWRDDDGGDNAGAVYVISLGDVSVSPGDGSVAVTVSASTKLSATSGGLASALTAAGGHSIGAGHEWGAALTSAGDLDRDGYDDLIVGACDTSTRGYIDLLYLDSQDKSVRAASRMSEANGGMPTSIVDAVAVGAMFGGSVSVLSAPQTASVCARCVAASAARAAARRGGGGGESRQTVTLAVAAGFNGGGSVFIVRLDVPPPGPPLPAALTRLSAAVEATAAAPPFVVADSVYEVSQTTRSSLGLAANDLMGVGASDLGDVDGDGVRDFALGSNKGYAGVVSGGAVYVMFASADGRVRDHTELSMTSGGLADAGVSLQTNDYFGSRLAGTGVSYDEDDVAELVVGASGTTVDGTPRSGAVYFVHLNADGTAKRVLRIAAEDGGQLGTSSEAAGAIQLGMSVACVPPEDDLDGLSSTGDIIVGAGHNPNYYGDVGDNRATLFVMFLNKPDASVRSFVAVKQAVGALPWAPPTPHPGMDTLYSIVWLGDLDGDGVGDLMVTDSTATDSICGNKCGAAYVLTLRNDTADGSYRAARWHALQDTLSEVGAWLSPEDRWGYGAVAMPSVFDPDAAATVALGAMAAYGGHGRVDIVTLDEAGRATKVVRLGPTSGLLSAAAAATIASDEYWSQSLVVVGARDARGVYLAVGSRRGTPGADYSGTVSVLRLDVPLDDPNDGAAPALATSATGVGGAQVRDWLRIRESFETIGTGTLPGGFVTSGQFCGWGNGVSSLGDVDGDGVDDAICSMSLDGDGGQWKGAALVMFMKKDGSVRSVQKLSETAGGIREATITGGGMGGGDGIRFEGSGRFGAAAVGIRQDWDGDGVGEVAIGSANADAGGSDRGAVFLLWLSSSGTVKRGHRISATADFDGGLPVGSVPDNSHVGRAIAVVPEADDLDGDAATAELVLSAHGDPDAAGGGGDYRGAVHVVSVSKATGFVVAHTKISETSGAGWMPVNPADSQYFGQSLAWLGQGGLAAGAYGDNAVYVMSLEAVSGGGAFHVASTTKLSASTGGVPAALLANGLAFGDETTEWGRAVCSLGDLDRDTHGVSELAVASSTSADDRKGAIDIVFLNPTWTARAIVRLGPPPSDMLPRTVVATMEYEWAVGSMAVLSATRDEDQSGRGRSVLRLGVAAPTTGDGKLYVLHLEAWPYRGPNAVFRGSSSWNETASRFDLAAPAVHGSGVVAPSRDVFGGGLAVVSQVCHDGCAAGCDGSGPADCVGQACAAGFGLAAGQGACCPVDPARPSRGVWFRVDAADAREWECGLCFGDCAKCVGPGTHECIGCAGGGEPGRGGQCACPEGTYDDGGWCEPCETSCSAGGRAPNVCSRCV